MNNDETKKATEHKLTEAERKLIDQMDASLTELAKKREGALLMTIASRDLKGNWGYADGKLVQAPAPKAPEPQK